MKNKIVVVLLSGLTIVSAVDTQPTNFDPNTYGPFASQAGTIKKAMPVSHNGLISFSQAVREQAKKLLNDGRQTMSAITPENGTQAAMTALTAAGIAGTAAYCWNGAPGAVEVIQAVGFFGLVYGIHKGLERAELTAAKAGYQENEGNKAIDAAAALGGAGVALAGCSSLGVQNTVLTSAGLGIFALGAYEVVTKYSQNVAKN